MKAQSKSGFAAINGSRVAIIPAAGHMTNMEKPAEVNRVILDFLAGLREDEAD